MKHLLLISAIGDLNLISGFSISLPLALGLIKLKSLDKEYMLLFVLISVSFIVEIIAGILSANAINNLWLGNIFFLTESLLWGLIHEAMAGIQKAANLYLYFPGCLFSGVDLYYFFCARLSQV
jgi:hypothetical protein